MSGCVFILFYCLNTCVYVSGGGLGSWEILIFARFFMQCKKIIWAQGRLIQLSAVSTPVLLQISDRTLVTQKMQTAIDAASLQPKSWSHVDTSGGKLHHEQTSGFGSSRNPPRESLKGTFAKPLFFYSASCVPAAIVPPPFRGWGCVRK